MDNLFALLIFLLFNQSKSKAKKGNKKKLILPQKRCIGEEKFSVFVIVYVFWRAYFCVKKILKNSEKLEKLVKLHWFGLIKAVKIVI